jgi:hypothetical protein
MLSELDPVNIFGTHAGYRVAQMKPPIPDTPAPTCNLAPCPVGPAGSYGPIAPNTVVSITGTKFPCMSIQPDDPATAGQQGSCLLAHTSKTVLVKRISTQLLEPSATVVVQTGNADGSYSINFLMPDVVGSGFADAYRFVPHAPDCAFNQGPSITDVNYPNTCESGRLNASGIMLFQ